MYATTNVEDSGSKIRISIVIPVYNQAKNVSVSLDRIKKTFDSILHDYEIIVVNDGSLDNTLEVLEREQSADSRVKVITYSPNRGKGYAVRTGITNSGGRNVLFTDGDLDISPEVIKDYVHELDRCDLVIASKRHPLSKVNAPRSRIFFSKAFNLLVRIVVGIKIKDTQSGLKAGRGDVLRTIFGVMLVKRYAFDVELLTIATALKLDIKEMPIEINIDRRFKFKDIISMFIDIMAISYRHRIRRQYGRQLQPDFNS